MGSPHRFRSDESLTDEPLRDPGNGGTLPVGRSGTLAIITGAGAETSTLPSPTFLSQLYNISMAKDGGGDRVISCSFLGGTTTYTSITINDQGDNIVLIGSASGIDANNMITKVWRLVVNNGCTIA